jgi:hypothetical protein
VSETSVAEAFAYIDAKSAQMVRTGAPSDAIELIVLDGAGPARSTPRVALMFDNGARDQARSSKERANTASPYAKRRPHASGRSAGDATRRRSEVVDSLATHGNGALPVVGAGLLLAAVVGAFFHDVRLQRDEFNGELQRARRARPHLVLAGQKWVPLFQQGQRWTIELARVKTSPGPSWTR